MPGDWAVPVFPISKGTNTSENHSPRRRIFELRKDLFFSITGFLLIITITPSPH